MNEIKKMFEHWRKFLKGAILTESITDKTLISDATNAKTFINFFVMSDFYIKDQIIWIL